MGNYNLSCFTVFVVDFVRGIPCYNSFTCFYIFVTKVINMSVQAPSRYLCVTPAFAAWHVYRGARVASAPRLAGNKTLRVTRDNHQVLNC